MIHGDNFIVDKENPNLPAIKTTYNYPVLYNGGLPAVIKEIKKPSWFERKIKTIKWNEFFQVEKNEMVTYRITPHANVTNNNKRLWRSIHKIYEMYEKAGTRLERDGFKFRYREKDLFWYDVVFKQEKGQKKIEFYLTTTEYQAMKLKRKIENKMSVTMKRVSTDCIRIPVENTIVQELRYLKHDIFSLNTHTTETKTPIASILNTVDELVFDNDFARLSICCEAERRSRWIGNASWAHEKASKGRIPMRAKINGKRLSASLKIGITGVVNEVNSLVVDTIEAISNSFFKSEKKMDKKKVIQKAHDLQDEIKSKKMSGATLEKINLPTFKTHIRVVAHSKDKLTRETIAETMSLSLSDLSEDNELQGIKINFNGRRIEVIEELKN